MQAASFTDELPVFQGDALLRVVADLIHRARKGGAPVIFIQDDGPDESLAATGGPGWEIHPRVAPEPDEAIVYQQTPDAFHDTGLEAELAELMIQRVVVCGLRTELSIDTTVRRARLLGYEVILPQDAHSTWDSGALHAQQIIDHHNCVLGGWFAQVKKAAEVSF